MRSEFWRASVSAIGIILSLIPTNGQHAEFRIFRPAGRDGASCRSIRTCIRLGKYLFQESTVFSRCARITRITRLTRLAILSVINNKNRLLVHLHTTDIEPERDRCHIGCHDDTGGINEFRRCTARLVGQHKLDGSYSRHGSILSGFSPAFTGDIFGQMRPVLLPLNLCHGRNEPVGGSVSSGLRSDAYSK